LCYIEGLPEFFIIRAIGAAKALTLQVKIRIPDLHVLLCCLSLKILFSPKFSALHCIAIAEMFVKAALVLTMGNCCHEVKKINPSR